MLVWVDGLPNLLIGLREGLEAGLVVSILLAALRKQSADQGSGRSAAADAAGVSPRSWPIWIGVLGAVSVAGSFAAVLTFSASSFGSRAQETVGGVLSLLAIVLVTIMIFWMRRAGRTLSGELGGKVGAAATLGAGALAVTAFMAVGREGLETTLFIWAAVQASASTIAPVIGAGVGIALAVLICWLIFRGALRFRLGVFFTRTAVVLIVIAAGILAYGLGDLQDAGILPGSQWVAVDVSDQAWSGSWWATLIQGLTQLRPKLSVLQVVAWIVYLGVVLWCFLRQGRRGEASATAEAASAAAAPIASAASAPAATIPESGATAAAVSAASPAARTETASASEPPKPASSVSGTVATADPDPRSRFAVWAERRVWVVAAGLVVVPALVATGIVIALPANTSDTTAVTVSASSCGTSWTGTTGNRTFNIQNTGSKAGEITLLNSGGAIVGEIETLGPGTTAALTATLGGGSYNFHCVFAGSKALDGPAVTVSGDKVSDATVAVKAVTLAELTPPNDAYQKYVATKLTTLQAQLTALRSEVAGGNTAAAKQNWLTAMMTWEEVGASYNSFGDLGQAVDSLPTQFEGGVNDPDFTGLHRVEYDLWQSAPQATALHDIDVTAAAVTKLSANLDSDDVAGDPTNLTLRVHEILEDALRDHLTGIDDSGAGAAYPMAFADVQVTRTVLGELAPLITARSPKLVATAEKQLDTLQSALLALKRPNGTWLTLEQATLPQRQRVDAAIGAVLETLSIPPDLLEVPPSQLQ